MDVKIIEADLVARGLRVALLASRFNHFIVDRLVEGATDCVKRHGGEDITLVRAPGAWELPLICQTLALSGRFDAIIALGCVIRGGTAHFDYVAGEAAKGLAAAGMASGVPVIFGVLTTESIEQAIERAGTKMGNKGAEAALSAIEMVDLMRKLE